MQSPLRRIVVAIVMLAMVLPAAVFAVSPLLSPASAGFGSQTRSQNYDTLMDALYASGKTTSVIGGDKLWVPWFKRSDSCTQADLQSGNNCNSGSTIDFTHNCMVTDEFSQVGVLVSMGSDQTRMDQFAKTVSALATPNGNLPGWRVYRNGDTILPCQAGINGNCDTASDADARVLVALFDAAKNPAFSATARAAYLSQAKALSVSFLQYEVDSTCRPSSLGHGQICYWLAAGSNAKRGGIASNDYGYTGYYADAIIAMLEACGQTGNASYCAAAGNFTLNYLEAAKFNGASFSTPPGRSFKWTVGAGGIPSANCTSGCAPVAWDDADAPRAFGMCGANYYAKQMGVTLPGLQAYCDAWESRYGRNPASIPTRYAPDGSATNAPQGSFFAQGLQAVFEAGASHSSDLQKILDNALSHYTLSTRTWDFGACFGVYHQAFPMRALGLAIGRDLAAFVPLGSTPPPPPPPPPPAPNGTNSTNTTNNAPPSNATNVTACFKNVQSLPVTCTGGVLTSDTHNGACRTLVCTSGSASLKVLACDKPSSASPTYFEMYQQAKAGTAVSAICLGATCITPASGYAKSPSYPICVVGVPVSGTNATPTNTTANTTNTTNTTTNTTNTTLIKPPVAAFTMTPSSGAASLTVAFDAHASTDPNGRQLSYAWTFGDGSTGSGVSVSHTYPSSGSFTATLVVNDGLLGASLAKQLMLSAPTTTCSVTVESLLVTCTGGTVTADSYDGACRTLVCTSGSASLKVLACDKPSSASPTYFEMYQQAKAGTAVSAICLGATCITPASGYAKSPSYPICN